MPVNFIFSETKATLGERTRLKSFIVSLFRKNKRQLSSLTYIFCTDAYLLEINKRFLQHDYYTDIITFNLADPASKIIGEVYISVDRVRENAKNHSASLNEELHRVIFHGALHLCGYKDKSAKDKIAMTAAEDNSLRRYFS